MESRHTPDPSENILSLIQDYIHENNLKKLKYLIETMPPYDLTLLTVKLLQRGEMTDVNYLITHFRKRLYLRDLAKEFISTGQIEKGYDMLLSRYSGEHYAVNVVRALAEFKIFSNTDDLLHVLAITKDATLARAIVAHSYSLSYAIVAHSYSFSALIFLSEKIKNFMSEGWDFKKALAEVKSRYPEEYSDIIPLYETKNESPPIAQIATPPVYTQPTTHTPTLYQKPSRWARIKERVHDHVHHLPPGRDI